MGSCWKKLAGFGFGATSAWVWRRVRLGSAPLPPWLASSFQGDDQRAHSRFGNGLHAADAMGAGSRATFADANASKDVVVGLNAHYRSHKTSLDARGAASRRPQAKDASAARAPRLG
jgi:hypothetical protein